MKIIVFPSRPSLWVPMEGTLIWSPTSITVVLVIVSSLIVVIVVIIIVLSVTTTTTSVVIVTTALVVSTSLVVLSAATALNIYEVFLKNYFWKYFLKIWFPCCLMISATVPSIGKKWEQTLLGNRTPVYKVDTFSNIIFQTDSEKLLN